MRFLAMLLAACLAAADAAAGAWTLPEGDGQLIMTTGRKIAPVAAFAGGLAEVDTSAAQLWVEYGVTDRWTLGATLFSDFSPIDEKELEIRLGMHVRHNVWKRRKGDVVALQAGAAVPVEEWLVGQLGESLPGSVPEAHVRALYGRGWQWGWGSSFVSTEVGFHWRGERAADEMRFDATAGHEPWKGVLGMFSVYSTVAVTGRGNPYLKLSPSVAYTPWPRLGPNDKKPHGEVKPSTFQLGLTWDVLNPEHGLELFVGIWRRF